MTQGSRCARRRRGGRRCGGRVGLVLVPGGVGRWLVGSHVPPRCRGVAPSLRALAADEVPEEWDREGVLAVPVLVDEARLAERCQHLAHVTVAERLAGLLRAIDD